MKETLKIGVSGVRGVVGESFTPQLAAAFAQAFGTLVGGGPVLVARDTRPSGLMIEHAVLAGLQSVGCKPVMLGVVPTPSLLYLVRSEGARGGIMITASHNPVEWNALKFVDRRGLFFDAVHAEELFDIYHQQEFPFVSEAELRSAGAWEQGVLAHFAQIVEYVQADPIRQSGFRVAVDCCNGVGALHTRSFLEGCLGCRMHGLYETPSGVFEREPEPLPENIGALSDLVRDAACDVGFAQDPDGDRLSVVDEGGQVIGEEITVALAVYAVLTQHGLGPVAANLSAGKSVERVATDLGCALTRTKTGEVHVTESLLNIGGVVGVEHTGGIIIPAIHPCRDSYAGMGVILELMAQTGEPISALCRRIPRYRLIKEKVPIRSTDGPIILRALRRHYVDRPMSFLDGVYIDFGDRWVHVRRSNTEPVLRLIAEAPDETATRALLDEVRGHIAALT